MQNLKCQYVDVIKKEIYPARVSFNDSSICAIEKISEAPKLYLVPGLIDAHIHIESSMLVPSRFAAEALKHGTIATVSDPHEIANVCGQDGIDFMIKDGKTAPFYFYFGAPSCVPATEFETSGAIINSTMILELLKKDEIHYLSEMMNYPGVIFKNAEVLKKIDYAHQLGMKIDGHAPGLRGEDLKKYFEAGISTDHECFSYEEAKEKAELGMKILIREGSAAKNYPALKKIISEYPELVMFCSDDKHPDDLLIGHINKLAARAIADGFDFWDVIRACTKNPYEHYNLRHGLAQISDPANFVLFKDLKDFEVDKVYHKGELLVENGEVKINLQRINPINNFFTYPLKAEDFKVKLRSKQIKVIEARDGELITGQLAHDVDSDDFEADIDNDILKIAVINRYKKSDPAIAWIKNFGLNKGALASTVAHDCHNIICVGTSDENISIVCNEIMQLKGGICVFDEEECHSLQLPVAGLMSDKEAFEVGSAYKKLDRIAKDIGSELKAPFMTLSFMALLVIPELKLSDKGLFNGKDFKFENLDAS